MPACFNRKRHCAQICFPSFFFFVRLIMPVCTHNLVLCLNIIKVTGGAPTQALGTKAPGTSLDIILFLSKVNKRDSEMETVRRRYYACVVCV